MTKSTQTSGSVFADRNERVKKTKLDLELVKNVNCFPDGHCNDTIKIVSFQIKSLYTNYFLNSKEICINQLIMQMI